MAQKEVFQMEESRSGEDDSRTAYSYVRFSTQKQLLGDSLRRQVEAAEKYAKENNLRLAARSFRDLGVSGFKQRNIKKGALAAFIGAVKSGLIAPGSVLLIEQFDRLTRAEINVAFRLLLDLVDLDIEVVTLVDERVWNSETVQDVANVLVSIILMSRAHEESKAKAKRLSEVWGQKKKRAGERLGDDGVRNIVTSECPLWLKPNADKTGFVVLKDKAESVQRVFQARIGGFGVSSIVTRANAEHWPVPGKSPLQGPNEDDGPYAARRARGATWHTSTVTRLLHNRAVLGEYQPYKTEHQKVKDEADKKVRLPVGEPLAGYYPAILDEETFLRAQAKAERSGRFPGRRDASLKNWLQGLLTCTCGASFVRKNKNSEAQPGYARYYCTARNRKVKRPDGTLCPGASALELETAVLEVVSTVAPQYFQGTARTETLKARADVLEVEVSVAKTTRDRYIDAIGVVGKSKAVPAALLNRYTEAEDALASVEKELAAARAELADLAGDFDTVFENIRNAVRSVDSLDARAALREDLSRIIEKVVVHQDDGYIEVHLRGEPVPVAQRLREDATLPGAEHVAQMVTTEGGFVVGLPQGLKIAPLTQGQHADYIRRLEEHGE